MAGKDHRTKSVFLESQFIQSPRRDKFWRQQEPGENGGGKKESRHPHPKSKLTKDRRFVQRKRGREGLCNGGLDTSLKTPLTSRLRALYFQRYFQQGGGESFLGHVDQRREVLCRPARTGRLTTMAARIDRQPTASRWLDPQVVSSLESLEFLATQVVEGFITGLHTSPYRGYNQEFAEHRPYQSGDELRYLDWKLFGRTDRFYVKQFEADTNLRATLVLDSSASMDFSGADQPHAESDRPTSHEGLTKV